MKIRLNELRGVIRAEVRRALSESDRAGKQIRWVNPSYDFNEPPPELKEQWSCIVVQDLGGYADAVMELLGEVPEESDGVVDGPELESRGLGPNEMILDIRPEQLEGLSRASVAQVLWRLQNSRAKDLNSKRPGCISIARAPNGAGGTKIVGTGEKWALMALCRTMWEEQGAQSAFGDFDEDWEVEFDAKPVGVKQRAPRN